MPARTSVKRSAPSTKHAEPPSKKVVVAKSKAIPRNAKGKPSSSESKKRRLPVTASEDAAEDSEWSDEEDDEFPLEGVDLDAAEEPNPNNDADADADVEMGDAKPKDPNASRESHKVQKELTRQRQAAKPHADLLTQAKRHWSLARQKNISVADRHKHVAQLMEAVRGRIQDVVFKHDASRVVQTIIKYGESKERDEIAAELKGRYRELSQNKYAKFLIPKLLRFCPTHRASIFSEFRHNVLRLLLHREASGIIADSYDLYANAAERDAMLMDFFGKEVALFEAKETAKPSDKRGLAAVLENADAERRKRILVALKDNLINMFNNPDKGAVGHAIVHRALWEYLRAINELPDEAEQEKKRREIFESCQEIVAEMVHTKDGSRAVREFLAQGSAKDRKQIVKVLKPHIERMCKDEEAQLVLFTALDVIDDTKLVAKSIIPEITAHASTFAFDSHKGGRRSLLYLLVPRSSRHFTPAAVATLSETDAARAKTSKKDSDVRVKELRVAASGALLRLVSDKAEELCRDPGASLLVTEIMLYAEGDKTSAIDALMEPISKTYPTPVPSDGELMHLIDISHSSRLYKTLIQGGHFDRSSSQVQTVPTFSASIFASKFLETVGKDNLVRMAKGNGAFVVAELSRRISEEGTAEEKKRLKSWFGKDVQSEIKEGAGKGSEVLLERLTEL